MIDNLRDKIISWVKKDKSNAHNRENRLREDLKNIVVVDVLSWTKEKEWQQILCDAKKSLKQSHPDKAATQIIDKIVKQMQKKSRKNDFLQAKAYSWLKKLVYDPPKTTWYPEKAINVAHAAFRLRGKVESFKNYMCQTSRIKVLQFFIKGKYAFALFPCAQVVLVRIMLLAYATQLNDVADHW